MKFTIPLLALLLILAACQPQSTDVLPTAAVLPGATTNTPIATEATAEATVDDVLRRIPRRGLHLAYLDPFNLGQLPFSVIVRLSRFPKIDIIVHFSVMDLQREIELDFDRDASRFEVFAPGWRAHIDIRTMTKIEARAKFVEYWLELVRKLGFKCSKEKPLLTNSNNGPLYRMRFLLRHPLAEKLWNDIARGDQPDLFDS